VNIDRRVFISTTGAGVASAAAARVLGRPAEPDCSVMPTKGEKGAKGLPNNAKVAGGKYRPPHRMGMGGVALGNGFAPISDAQALATMQAAWDAGVRYFDTSPFYGFGLSEHRMGDFLHAQKPDDYVISTKVGRVFKAAKEPPNSPIWKSPAPFSYRFDYTAEGTRRSIEDSLMRLGAAQIDIVFIHDLSPDTPDLGRPWTEAFDEAAKGAMPELTKMREEGVIKAWGFGVNRPDAVLRAIEIADPDICLLATQYSLIDHQEALDKTFPALEKKGVSVVVGAPLNAGFLGGRDRYHYSGTFPPGVKEKRRRLMEICETHGVDLRTAALQFAAAPAVVSSVIPGARCPDQVRANVESMSVKIPAAFWNELREKGLLARNAPVPGETQGGGATGQGG